MEPSVDPQLNLGSVLIKFKTDTSELKKAKSYVQDFSSTVQSDFKKSTGSMNRFKESITGVKQAVFSLKGVLVGLGVKALINTADNYSILTKRIKLATEATGDFAAVFSTISEISKETGTSLSANVKLFEAFARMANEVGTSNSETLQIVRSLGQISLIGGMSRDDTNSMVLQFSHIISGGVVNMQEFNSLLLHSTVLVGYLAKGFKMTTGELKKAVGEGKVLAVDVVEALLSQMTNIQNKSESFTDGVVVNFRRLMLAAQEYVGHVNDTLKITKAIAFSLRGITFALDKFNVLIKPKELFPTQEPESGGEEKRARIRQEKLLEELRNTFQSRFVELEKSFKDELTLENEHYQSSLMLLKVSEEAKIESTIGYFKLRELLEKRHNDKLKEYSEEHKKLQVLSGVFNIDLTRKIADMTLHEQSSMFRQQLDLAASNNEKLFKIQKAFNLASAVMDGQRAFVAAYASGVALGGVALGTIFGAMAIAATAANIANISSMSFSGDRATGGGVAANGLYGVNEKGPELLSLRGKDYLMMGSQSGHITPNNMLSGNVVVNVKPPNGYDVHTRSRKNNGDTILDIELIEEHLAQGIFRGSSPLANSLQSLYGLNRAAGTVL